MSSFYNYYFTGKTRQFEGVTVRQIARMGDHQIGGWIEHERNLVIQDVRTPAWVGGDAVVYGDAVVDCAAVVDGDAVVVDSHITYGSVVTGCAVVKNSKVFGRSLVSHQAVVVNSIVDDSIVESSAKVQNAELKFCKFKGWAEINGGNYYNRRYDGQFWWK